jgi:hypothetical protein
VSISSCITQHSAASHHAMARHKLKPQRDNAESYRTSAYDMFAYTAIHRVYASTSTAKLGTTTEKHVLAMQILLETWSTAACSDCTSWL